METGQRERAIVTVTRIVKEGELHARWLLGLYISAVALRSWITVACKHTFERC